MRIKDPFSATTEQPQQTRPENRQTGRGRRWNIPFERGGTTGRRRGVISDVRGRRMDIRIPEGEAADCLPGGTTTSQMRRPMMGRWLCAIQVVRYLRQVPLYDCWENIEITPVPGAGGRCRRIKTERATQIGGMFVPHLTSPINWSLQIQLDLIQHSEFPTFPDLMYHPRSKQHRSQ